MNQLSEFIKLMADSGVIFSLMDEVDWCDFPVNETQLLSYLENPDLFFAKKHGVSVEVLRAYRDAVGELNQCMASTKKGTRCPNHIGHFAQNSIKNYELSFSTGDWSPYYCTTHQKMKEVPVYDPSSPSANNRKSKPRKRKGFVYLVRGAEGLVKIGKTVDLSNRLKTFAVKLPFPIEEEFSFKCNDYTLSERLLHVHFSEKRLDGEWFSLSEDDISLIKNNEFLASIGIEVIE